MRSHLIGLLLAMMVHYRAKFTTCMTPFRHCALIRKIAFWHKIFDIKITAAYYILLLRNQVNLFLFLFFSSHEISRPSCTQQTLWLGNSLKPGDVILHRRSCPTLAQVMAWCRTKPVPEPVLTWSSGIHSRVICILTSNELIPKLSFKCIHLKLQLNCSVAKRLSYMADGFGPQRPSNLAIVKELSCSFIVMSNHLITLWYGKGASLISLRGFRRACRG